VRKQLVSLLLVPALGWSAFGGSFVAYAQEACPTNINGYTDEQLQHFLVICEKEIADQQQVLTLTQWGLILVGFGILGTLLPGVAVCNVGGQLGIKVLFVIGVCVYFYKLFRLISQAFESN